MIERHLLKHAARVHFTSEQELKEAQEIATDIEATVLPLGVAVNEFQFLPPSGQFRLRYSAHRDKILLLFLSRLDPKKGLDLLLPAFAQLRRQRDNLALVLAGSGTPAYEAELRAMVRELEIEQDVIFTGFVSGEDKLAVLADCDLFVLPSYSENFGVVVVEAMASGLPLIISDQIGLADDIARAEAGMVVPCQVTPLVNAMQSLLDDPERRQDLAANGRQLAHKRYSLEASTRALLDLYQSILAPVSHSQST